MKLNENDLLNTIELIRREEIVYACNSKKQIQLTIVIGQEEIVYRIYKNNFVMFITNDTGKAVNYYNSI